jgi:hypothetical protein
MRTNKNGAINMEIIVTAEENCIHIEVPTEANKWCGVWVREKRRICIKANGQAR